MLEYSIKVVLRMGFYPIPIRHFFRKRVFSSGMIIYAKDWT